MTTTLTANDHRLIRYSATLRAYADVLASDLDGEQVEPTDFRTELVATLRRISRSLFNMVGADDAVTDQTEAISD